MYIAYRNDEHYLTLRQSLSQTLTSSQTAWIGKITINGTEITVLEFEEESGLVSKLSYIDVGVENPEQVLFERLNTFLKEFRQTEQAGFENTETSEEVEPVPYDPDQIVIRRDNYSVFQVLKMIDDDELNLSPDFQRNLVWDNIRKSRLIESVLLGIPLPVFYFAENRDGTFNVVDGLQRLSTLKDFASNNFYLRNLEYLKAECERRYFEIDPARNIQLKNVLEKKYTARINRAQLVVNVIEAKSPLKVKYDIFKRINEGGRPLNNQEIRNCMATPETRKYLKDMARSPEFKDATGESVNDVRMDAQELVLRFTAFYIQRKRLIEPYTGDMNTFLDSALEWLNNRRQGEFSELQAAFKNGMKNAYHLFGQYCFRKCLPDHLKRGAHRQLINKSLFTTWSIELSGWDNAKVVKFEKSSFASILATEFAKYEDYYWVVTTRTTDRKSISEAFKFTRQLLNSHL